MSHASNRRELGRLIRAAQQAVNKSMDDVLAELEAPQPEGARLSELLRTFRDHVAAQYRLEERGGLMGEEVEDPGTDRLTEAMVERHRSIERRAEGLARLAQRGNPLEGSALESLAGEARLLFDDYGRQETKEINLHQEVILRDTGGED